VFEKTEHINSQGLLNDLFIPCAIDFSPKMLVNGNNFMFTQLGRLFFASTPPPRAAHHRHPKCGVLHGEY
jgi:hypothetical protein